MPKMKSHKGVLKRMKVTAKGKVKYKKSFTGHLMSHKSGDDCRRLRGDSYVKKADIGRIEKLLGRPLQGV